MTERELEGRAIALEHRALQAEERALRAERRLKRLQGSLREARGVAFGLWWRLALARGGLRPGNLLEWTGYPRVPGWLDTEAGMAEIRKCHDGARADAKAAVFATLASLTRRAP